MSTSTHLLLVYEINMKMSTCSDDWVNVNTNAITDNGQGQYSKVTYTTDYGVEYDYGSVMHYGGNVSFMQSNFLPKYFYYLLETAYQKMKQLLAHITLTSSLKLLSDTS